MSPAPATPASRASRPTSASTAGRDGPLQGRHAASTLPPRHLPDGLLRRRRRPQGRPPCSPRPPAAEPAGLRTEAVDRAGRLRQLGRVGVLDRAGRRRLGHLLRQARARGPAPEASHVLFVVRDDDGHSDLLFQTSDTTWQAYNHYGGNSLYAGGRPDRPRLQGQLQPAAHHPRATRPRTAPFNAEYPMVRWLERNGYDVSYTTGVDTDRRGAELLEHQAFLSVGHDEYWSGAAARQRRSGPRRRRQPRLLQRQRGLLEDALGEQHRRLGTLPHAGLYKETHANAKIDPDRTSGPAPGATRASARRPTAAARRTRSPARSSSSTPAHAAIEVPAADGKLRLWRNTSVAALAPGQTATLADGTLGYEWDEDLDNGFPPGRPRPPLLDDGERRREAARLRLELRPGHGHPPPDALPRPKRGAGALVFGAGTVQWSWGLDGDHDRGGDAARPVACSRRPSTCFADMGVQPGTLQADLAAAIATTDADAADADDHRRRPTARRSSSGCRSRHRHGRRRDGRWPGRRGRGLGRRRQHLAPGHAAASTWSYTWTPEAAGRSDDPRPRRRRQRQPRAAPATRSRSTSARSCPCPCSIWDNALRRDPERGHKRDRSRRQVPLRQPGYITGLRFYKSAGNTGTHVGHLWTRRRHPAGRGALHRRDGVRLAAGQLRQPVRDQRRHDLRRLLPRPHGSYAPDATSSRRVDNAPLHAPAGGNGVFTYNGGFADLTPATANYWADVVFAPDDASAARRHRRRVRPTAAQTWRRSDVSHRDLRRAAQAVARSAARPSSCATPPVTQSPPTVVYSGATRTATLTPTAPLAPGGPYTATGVGVQDIVGEPARADGHLVVHRAPAATGPTRVRRSAASRSTSRPLPARPAAAARRRRPLPAAAISAAPRVSVGPGRRASRRTASSSCASAVRAASSAAGSSLRLRHAGHDAAERTLTLRGGTTRRFTLELSQRARRALARKGSIRVKAITVARGQRRQPAHDPNHDPTHPPRMSSLIPEGKSRMSSRILRTTLLATLLLTALAIAWTAPAGAQAPVRPADRSWPSPGRPVQPLLRGDPPRRRTQRVPAPTSQSPHRARRATRSILCEGNSAPSRRDAGQLGPRRAAT